MYKINLYIKILENTLQIWEQNIPIENKIANNIKLLVITDLQTAKSFIEENRDIITIVLGNNIEAISIILI